MKEKLLNLEAKMFVAKNRMLEPLRNRSAVDEGSNSGIRGTVSLVVTLLIVSLIIVLALIVAKRGKSSVDDVNTMFQNLDSAIQGVNDKSPK